jgi:hypothetical protein
MRRLILVSIVMLSTAFFLVGCGGGGSQAHNEHHAPQSHGAILVLHPEGDSGVSGTASFEDVSDGVVVKLRLRSLPKPDTLYLAHIHPGTCAEGEAHGGHRDHGEHAEDSEDHEHGVSEEIEYPLSQVKTNSEGEGSSTTMLHHTSVDKLFSGEPKMHVNVHKPGPGEPPPVTCANLDEAR